MRNLLRKPPFAIALTIWAVVSGTSGYLASAQAHDPTADKATIAQEVQQELKRLIDEEGALDQAIERGIQAYIKKQQTAAQAKQAEAAAARAKKAKDLRPVSATEDHILGDPEAPISMVEYSDFECPFCKRFHPTAKALMEKNAGKVNWVYRHFPLQFHNPGAQKQAEASECAAELGGNEAFWRYSDLIYERTKAGGKGFPLKGLVPLAEEIGLDGKAFVECLDSGKMRERVEKDYQDGVKAGISGTPGVIFVNHASGEVKTVAGAVPLAQLQSAVDQLAPKGSEKGSEKGN